MIEVEIRARVNELDEIRAKLEELGAKQVNKVHQLDRTFSHPMFLDENHSIFDGGFSARVRQVDEKVKIDFKEICRDKKHGMQVSAPVSSAEMGVEFLKRMGWEESFTIDKIRETFSLDGFKICLDNIQRIGIFIEIEKEVALRAGADQAREDCKELMKKLSPKSDVMTDYYGDLMFRLVGGQKKL